MASEEITTTTTTTTTTTIGDADGHVTVVTQVKQTSTAAAADVPPPPPPPAPLSAANKVISAHESYQYGDEQQQLLGPAAPPVIVTARSNTQPWWERWYFDCYCVVLRPRHLFWTALTLTVSVIVALVPLWIYDAYFKRHDVQQHVVAWTVGGIFAGLATLLSILLIVQHMIHYSRPELQRYIIRILWMVPIYAIESYFSLVFTNAALYLETAREWYEAYVIYCFFYLLMIYCAHSPDISNFQTLMAKRPQHQARHLPPFNWVLPEWRIGAQFLRNCRLGVLQYVAVRAICTAVTFGLNFKGLYCEGELTAFKCGYVYVSLIVNFSQVWAMYCLVLFYHACQHDLAPLRPLPKLICIKSIVFLSFWQSVLVAGAEHFTNVIQPTTNYSAGEVARGFQDLLIVVEMFVCAVAHHFVFPYQDVTQGVPTDTGNFWYAFKQSSLPTDVVRDAMRGASHTTLHAVVVHSSSTSGVKQPLLSAVDEEDDLG